MTAVGRAEPSELGEIIQHSTHALDVSEDDIEQALPFCLSEIRKLAQHLCRAHRCANTIPQLVGQRAIERAQALLAFVDLSFHA